MCSIKSKQASKSRKRESSDSANKREEKVSPRVTANQESSRATSSHWGRKKRMGTHRLTKPSVSTVGFVTPVRHLGKVSHLNCKISK